MEHLTFEKASKEITVFNVMVEEGFIEEGNEQPIDEAIKSGSENI